MKKQVVFSFDDARADTYTNAYAILGKYGFSFTLNVTSDFVLHPKQYHCFTSSNNMSMTVDQLIECQKNGIEIACHGHTHQNTATDVLDNIATMEKMGLDVSNVGFASPFSEITKDNGADIKALKQEGKLSYIRSGIQVRREGLLYAALTWIERKTHSPWLFWLLNRRNIISDTRTELLPSIGITCQTTLQQLAYFIDHMQASEGVIFMFHSILHVNDPGYGADEWYYDAERFDQLCNMLFSDPQVSVITTSEMLKNQGD